MISINKISKNLVKYKLYIILILIIIIIFNYSYRYFNIFEYNNPSPINEELFRTDLDTAKTSGTDMKNSAVASISYFCQDYNNRFNIKNNMCIESENFENRCNMASHKTPNFSTISNSKANIQSRNAQKLYQSTLCKNKI
tara:strand:- start:533 stop:952 length:420 start_codon:yes stop_codon:yes gene_type:complete